MHSGGVPGAELRTALSLLAAAEERTTDALARLAAQAEHHRLLSGRDPLTGLANRTQFHERVNAALAGHSTGDIHVLLVDLDDFKEVNVVFGHQSGDDLLVEVGQRLTACVRPEDTVARLGGAEFVILVTDGEDPATVASRIVSAFRKPTYIDDVEVRMSVGIGISSAEDSPLQGFELLRRASIALHAAKAVGKNRSETFRPEMMSALLIRSDLEAGVRRAVERQEISVQFQAIVSTEDIDAAQMEVLARWQRPTGPVAPTDFIPASERTGTIIGIGEEVLRQACQHLGGWLDASEHRSIAVNVSAVQIREEHFAERVLSLLRDGRVRPEQVVVEVTESVFMIPGKGVSAQLAALREHGVRIAIDDFGTGYSSLGRLQDLPVDAIKVDKAFVDKIVTGDEDLPILDSMIDMAHNLGLHVTAEGVESDVQAAQLIRLGCDALQGYLFSRPQPASEVPASEKRSTDLMRRLLGESAVAP